MKKHWYSWSEFFGLCRIRISVRTFLYISTPGNPQAAFAGCDIGYEEWNTERINSSWKGVDGLSKGWSMRRSRDQNGGGSKRGRRPDLSYLCPNPGDCCGTFRIYTQNYKRIIDHIVKNSHCPISFAYGVMGGSDLSRFIYRNTLGRKMILKEIEILILYKHVPRQRLCPTF